MKKILLNKYNTVAVLSVAFLVYCGLSFAGFNLGMTGAVKNTIKILETNKRNQSNLNIKGNFTGTGSSSVRKSDAVGTIKKIAVITYNWFRVENINSTDFSIPIMTNEIGKPVGLVFIDDQDKVAGCLQIVASSTDTLNLLPLTKVKDGVTQIDLQLISFSTDTYGNIAVPEYDPVGADKEIPFSQDEKILAAKITKVLGSILKDPDINNNGIVDFIENRFFKIGFRYGLNVGQLPAGGTDGTYSATIDPVVTLNGFRIDCKIFPDYVNNSLPITFPATYTWTHGSYTGHENSDSLTQNFDGPGEGTVPPVDGEYIVDANSIGCGTLTFNVVGQQDAVDSILILAPTFHISGGKLQKISWVWKAYNNLAGDPIDGSAFVDNLAIQISGETSTSYNSYGGVPPDVGYHNWAGTTISGSDTEHVIGVNNLDWAADCHGILFRYDDKFGNRVNVSFRK
ncbi:MAG: hypothetical protein AUJ85_08855 [Elusimicrobia bacterium CG1_02_37_114]|nr:MAG: hypothetical protein AUJ85_08855 [Elusimicrobia bacterium CG1_02_37_114]PIV53032.1 MAG: hypothetical protein COS17_06075 [Elusimicrobia bacterium CG02_land_8_20_14_3_00_37_13]PIZ13972.1 MAG: hypothetical protein COY53_02080 [Elusimicrobia bacterium CG_4_10_14_0_8_um_filter_37_32]